jgi:hypothetical protein
MFKLILAMILSILFMGCNETNAYFDTNCSISLDINKKFKTFDADIACDKRGFAYYQSYSVNGGYTYTPIFRNGVYGAYQLECKDL